MSKSEQEIREKVLDELVEFILKDLKEVSEKKEKFEVEVPNLKGKCYLDEDGALITITTSDTAGWRGTYPRGLIFDTEEEARRYDKERLLLFKIKKWAEIHNEGRKPRADELKFYIYHDIEDNELGIDYNDCYNYFSKLPYFKTEEIAQACIDEFGDEIMEVLC